MELVVRTSFIFCPRAQKGFPKYGSYGNTHISQVPLPQGPDIAVPPCYGLPGFGGKPPASISSSLEQTVPWQEPGHAADTHIYRLGPGEAAVVFSCQNQSLF